MFSGSQFPSARALPRSLVWMVALGWMSLSPVLSEEKTTAEQAAKGVELLARELTEPRLSVLSMTAQSQILTLYKPVQRFSDVVVVTEVQRVFYNGLSPSGEGEQVTERVYTIRPGDLRETRASYNSVVIECRDLSVCIWSATRESPTCEIADEECLRGRGPLLLDTPSQILLDARDPASAENAALGFEVLRRFHERQENDLPNPETFLTHLYDEAHSAFGVLSMTPELRWLLEARLLAGKPVRGLSWALRNGRKSARDPKLVEMKLREDLVDVRVRFKRDGIVVDNILTLLPSHGAWLVDNVCWTTCYRDVLQGGQ